MGIGTEIGLRSVGNMLIVDGMHYAQTPAGIQAAIDALPGAGGTVRIPQGTYEFSATLDIDTLSNVVLEGEGPSTILKIADNLTAASAGDMINLIDVVDSSYINIRNLTLDGNYQNQAMAHLAMRFGTYYAGLAGFSIQYIGAGSACSLTITGNVLSTTCTGAGADDLSLDLTAAANDSIGELETVIEAFNGGSKYTVVLNSDYATNSYSAHLASDTYADVKTAAVDILFDNTATASTHEIYGNDVFVINSNHITIESCVLKNAPHIGVLFTRGVTESRIINNHGSYCSWKMAEIWPNGAYPCYNNIVSGNNFSDSYQPPIAAETQYSFNNLISNNVVSITDLDFSQDLEGISVSGPMNVVRGNILRGCRLHVGGASADYNIVQGNMVDARNSDGDWTVQCLFLQDGDYNVITGNVFYDAFHDTIWIAGDSNYNTVANNLLTTNISVTKVGIRIRAGSTGNRLHNNVIYNHVTDIEDLGTDTVWGMTDNVRSSCLAGILPRITSEASSATPTPNADTTDQYCLTALAEAAAFAVPSGTPVNGQKMTIRILDNATGRALTWNAIYRVVDTTLPTTTTASKTIYVGLIYNSADTKWDVVAVAEES